MTDTNRLACARELLTKYGYGGTSDRVAVNIADIVDAEVKAAVEWTPVSERLPEVEAGQVGVEVWITYLKPESANAIVFKGHYTTSDATGFRWWRDVNPLGISDRGVESVLGGRILAWKYCEKKPQPYQPKEEQDAAKMS